MPLDFLIGSAEAAPAPAPAAADPFVDAGFSLNPDGTYSAPVGPLAPPTATRPVIEVSRSGAPGSQTVPAKPMPELAPAVPPAAPPAPAAPGETPAPTPPAAVPAVAYPGGNSTAPAASPAPPPPATVAPQPAPGKDPFVDAGFKLAPDGSYINPLTEQQRPPGTPPPPPPAEQQGPPPPPSANADQPWYKGLWNAVHGAGSAFDAAARHSITFGFDEIVAPVPAAALISLVHGIPFSKAYDQQVAQMRAERHNATQDHPVAELTGSVFGAGATGGPAVLGKLFSTGKGVLPVARNITAGAGLGALGGFGETEGDINQRLVGARKGAQWGAGLTLGLPLVLGAGKGIYHSLTPKRRVPVKAGQQYREMTGGRTPVPQDAPIPNFPLGVGGATGYPGLAAAERIANTVDDVSATARRAGQQTAIRDAATTAQRSGTQLATQVMTPAQASTRLAGAMRDAMQVFRDMSDHLWNSPALAKVMDIPDLHRKVMDAGRRMAHRDIRAIETTPNLRATIEDIAALPHNATLADVNAIRSDLLAIARDSPDKFVQRVAGNLGRVMLQAMDNNPAMLADPAARAAYNEARRFTELMYRTIGQKAFRPILAPNANDATAGSKLFNFDKFAAERVPQGIDNVLTVLDNIRDQWRVLGRSGLQAEAQAAMDNLGQGARDYIINSMIAPIEASVSGVHPGDLNALNKWITRNRQWLTDSGLFHPAQLDLLGAIQDSAEMGARVLNLRGGSGSETAERLMRGGVGSRAIDLFSTVLNTQMFAMGGAWIGSQFGNWGMIVGAMLGAGGGVGTHVLQRLYQIPAERLRALLIEAASNPRLAQNLMRDAATFDRQDAATVAWFRKLGADMGGGGAAMGENYQNQPQEPARAH